MGKERTLKVGNIEDSADMESSRTSQDKDTFMMQGLRAASTLLQRVGLGALLNKRFSGNRNYYTVFGYETNLKYEQFYQKYLRQDIVSRIIDAPPGATWANPPSFTTLDNDPNEELQTAWDKLHRKHNLWGALHRADRLARLGYFSVILLGFDRGTMNTPVPQGAKLTFVRPLSMENIEEIKFVNDQNDPRFGKPEIYKIKQEVKTRTTMSSTENLNTKALEVHWSRVIHVVENPLEDEIIGIPIIERIFNLLDDLMKVAGGTAETYWLTANRGLHINIDKDMDMQPSDETALSDEIEEYQHQLRRVIRTRGVEVDGITTKTPSPDQTFNMIMSLLSGTTGIPRRILLGSEAGQLASEQDRANWAERIDERRSLFAEPRLLVPFVQRLQLATVLPKGEFGVEWPSAFVMSPLESSQVSAQKARAVGNLARQIKDTMQVTSEQEAREIVGLEGKIPEGERVVLLSPTKAPADTKNGQDKEDDDFEEDGDSPRNPDDVPDTRGS